VELIDNNSAREADMGTIENDDYRSEEEELKADPIVQAMAREAKNAPRHKLYHMTGDPRIAFMARALDEYKKRGGTKAKTFGSVARAITALNKEQG
jgi:hypothetical protein